MKISNSVTLWISLSCATLLLSACSPKIKPFLWLLGTWEMHRSAGGSRIETWSLRDDLSMTGRGILHDGKDTTLLEKIELVYKDDGFWYIPTVPDQNNAMPIAFKMVSNANNIFTFENAAHDFPQRIIYRFLPASQQNGSDTTPRDSLLVRVETLEGNGIDYGFARH